MIVLPVKLLLAVLSFPIPVLSTRLLSRLHSTKDLDPTTCTGIRDGVDAYDKAAEEALAIRDEKTECHVSDEQGWKDYPHQDIEASSVEICVTNDRSTRYIFSNGLPDHSILKTSERAKHCVVRYGVAMPFTPTYDGSYLEENPVAGPLGFAINGVPLVDAAWAVHNGFLMTDEAWNGHSHSGRFYWHYHSSRMPPSGLYPNENQLVGFAMDGFPIYGPTNHALDVCNGRVVNGKYRYHMVRMEDIDFASPQCNEKDPRVHNWNPIIACFRGNTSQSRVFLDNPLDDSNRDGMFCSPADLVSCLQAIPGDVVVVSEDDISYTSALQCHNSGRVDRQWSPRAIIRVTSAEQVSEAVQCATMFDVTVTPRSGAHGFENEACSGELIVDVSGLESLAVDTNTKVVEFGSGHLHGQLYSKLANHGLVVAGGTENSVGTAGLWLGCGRGPLSQIHGLSCDSILGIEFVDANGNIRMANSTIDTDMYWMARGSGGEFPGVVTKFIVQAYDMPLDVWAIKIKFRSDQVHALIKEWAGRIDELSDPSRSMFTNIHSFLGNPILSMSCYGCTDAQKEWMKTQFDEISGVAGGGFEYNEWGGGWLDRLLKEDWDSYDTVEDLMEKPQWPEVWAVMANGAHMVPTADASDEMLDVIQNALETYGNGFYLFLYSLTGAHITSIPLTETAYGGREAKYTVHYKLIGNTEKDVKFPLREMSVALDGAGQECKGFYNYADREFPCAAASGELWLGAHFSDVPRMRSIKQSEDPYDRFMSDFKGKKWREDPNQVEFVGWPDVGDWGGTCTCPNGAVYQVGDNSDSCQSLACIGGVSGSCSSENPGGAGYRVVCLTPETTTPAPTIAAASPSSPPDFPAPTSRPAAPTTDAPTTAPQSAPTDTTTTAPQSAPTDAPTTAPQSAPTDAPTTAPQSAPITATFSPQSPSASTCADKPITSFILVVFTALAFMME